MKGSNNNNNHERSLMAPHRVRAQSAYKDIRIYMYANFITHTHTAHTTPHPSTHTHTQSTQHTHTCTYSTAQHTHARMHARTHTHAHTQSVRESGLLPFSSISTQNQAWELCEFPGGGEERTNNQNVLMFCFPGECFQFAQILIGDIYVTASDNCLA